MKEISYATVLHVISEPGDMTRYDYLVYRDGPDTFKFLPALNHFKYPVEINIYDFLIGIDEISENAVLQISKKYDCNSHTTFECCKTALSLWNNTAIISKR